MKLSELQTRIITGFLLSVLVSLILFWSSSCIGSIALIFTVLALTLGCAYEWSNFSSAKFRPLAFGLCLLPALFELLTGLGNHGFCGYEWRVPRGFGAAFVGLIVALCFSCAISFYRHRSQLEAIRQDLSQDFPALLLIGVGSAALLGIATLSNAGQFLAWLIVVVCGNDVGAYFFGKRFGKSKLAPAISPNKTVEGSLFGLLCGVGSGGALAHWAPYVELSGSIVLAFFVVLAAQLADLVESYLKRIAGVKDSGSLLPGHGGIFDRLDAMLGAAPVLYAWIFWNSWI